MNSAVVKLGRVMKRSNMWGLKRFINLLYWNPKTVVLTMQNFDALEVDGCKFAMNDQVDSVMRVKGNPWFSGVKQDDVVLDIGANIGAVSIPLASKAKSVYAVEPLFIDELQKNIELNALRNVTILPFGLGDKYTRVKITFGPREGYADMKTFSEIQEIIGEPVTFLKCDCEGGEWQIKPEQMKGIRELRFEFHIRRGREKKDMALLEGWYEWLDKNGYKKDISYGDEPGPTVEFSQCLLLRASKNGK